MLSRRWEKQDLLRSTACRGEALLDATGTESTLSQKTGRRMPGGRLCLPKWSPAILPSSFLLSCPLSFYLKFNGKNLALKKTHYIDINKYLKKKKATQKPKNLPLELTMRAVKPFSAWKILLVSFSYCLIPALSYTEWVNTFYKVLIHT